MNSVAHMSESGPSERWLRLAALSWDRLFLLPRLPGFFVDQFPCVELDDFIEDLGVTENHLGFITPINLDSVLKNDDVWSEFEAWLDQRVPPPDEFFSRMGWPLTEGQVTMDLVPLAPTAQRFAMLLGRKGYLRVRGAYWGRDEGGYYFEPIDVDWMNEQQSRGWPDQRNWSTRKVIVVASHLTSQLLWSAAKRWIAQHNTDFYAHTDPQLFGNHMMLQESDDNSISSQLKLSVLALALPDNLQSLPFTRILELREDLRAARAKFQGAVEDLLRDCYRASGESTLTKLLAKDVLELAREKYEEARKAYQRARVQTVIRGLTLAFVPPAILSTVASALHISLFEPASIMAGISLSVADLLNRRDEAEAQRHGNSWAYLADLGTALRASRKQCIEMFEDEPFRRIITTDEYNRYM